MRDFLELFNKIVCECNYTNTYKLAWARSLVEISMREKGFENEKNIYLNEISKRFLKYYWNQTIFYDLIQGSNISKTPIIIQYTKILIKEYFELQSNDEPVKFEKIEDYLKSNLLSKYNMCLNNISKALKKDVSWRFIYIDGKYQESIYKYEKNNDYISIEERNLRVLNKYHEDLFDLIDYRWGLIIDSYKNRNEDIGKKVKIVYGIDYDKLKKYRKILGFDEENISNNKNNNAVKIIIRENSEMHSVNLKR